MRALPDNPSADFLRQEAKDLLVALREVDPGTTLSTAQRRLADHYGFRQWSDLVAAVETSRSSRPQGSLELTTELAAAFGLGAVTEPMTPVIYEYMGRRWRVRTDKGDFIAGPVFDWIDESQAEIAASLVELARGKGVAAPEPVRAADRSLVKKIAGESWRVDRWMEYGPAPMPPVRSVVASRIGEILATLHTLRVPARGPINPFLTYRRAESDWEEVIARGAAAGKPWVGDLKALMPNIAELRELDPGVPPDELQVCHSNVILENVRLGPGDELVVLGWDFAGPMSPTWELGSVLWHWAMHPTIHLPAGRALIEGYSKVSGEQPRLELGTFAVAITGWLNWAYNQFCESATPENQEGQAFADREIRDLVEHPLSVAKIEEFVQALNG